MPAQVTGINAIETSFVKDYGSTVELLAQQKMSKLRMSVTEQSFRGESAAFIEQVGEVAAQKRVTRHGDTPLVPTPMGRRWVFPTDYEVADLIDSQDRLRQIIDPTSPFARAQAAALGRAMDDELIAGILGDNKTGQDAGTTTSFDSNMEVAVGSTGLTIDKLRSARELLLNNDVDVDDEEVYLALTPKQEMQLLETTEVTSSDYNTIKALVQGQINTFLGFRFICSTRLPGATNYNVSTTIYSPSANEDTALFYTKRGVGLALWNDITARIDERADKSYATQVYAKATCGATRLQEEKVGRIVTKNNV